MKSSSWDISILIIKQKCELCNISNHYICQIHRIEKYTKDIINKIKIYEQR